jgi:hypothetical protein
MLELIQITNDQELARRCDALDGMRLLVDLERMNKAERQYGRNTFISNHALDDVGRIRSVVRRSTLMVRLNPLHSGTNAEVDASLAQGADWLMLPMFTTADELHSFCAVVGGRAPVVALLETAGALESMPHWLDAVGLREVYVGLNDLHVSLGQRFMFEPLAMGLLDHVAGLVRRKGLRFGFGGIARIDEGLLAGRDVLAEHLRLGSQAVILSRTFQRDRGVVALETGVASLREAERLLAKRSVAQIETDRLRIAAAIGAIARGMNSQSVSS